MQVIHEHGLRVIKAWVGQKEVEREAPSGIDGGSWVKYPVQIPDIEDTALHQLKNLAALPFIDQNGIAVMPDVHAGIGATVGSVIATRNVVIPAAVGVDIGCGMNAVRTSLTASDLPDSLHALRTAIEAAVPVGFASHGQAEAEINGNFSTVMGAVPEQVAGIMSSPLKTAAQLGTLGGGNHFIEVCLDEGLNVWVMLHSGSRNIGNQIGRKYIDLAKEEMERWHIDLPDRDLAYLPEGSRYFDDYRKAVEWAQDYAMENRRFMMGAVVDAMKREIKQPFILTSEAVNCHHNYIGRESHFGRNLWVTRKGAISARKDQLGVIPGSMGQRSYIVKGKGNAESYCSCSHGAGRVMSRSEAKRTFTMADLDKQMAGVEFNRRPDVIDEIPGAYKDIDVVMANQADLVDVVHTLKQVMVVKG